MKIALLGDLAPFGRYCLAKNPAVKEEFAVVQKFLKGYDFVVANLEAPFSENERPFGFKSAHLKSHPSNIEILKYLGVTHVTLANNHIGDFGENAYKRTIELLEKSGIEWFGTEQRVARIDAHGEKVV